MSKSENNNEDNGLIINFPNDNYTKIDEPNEFSGVFNNFKLMDFSWHSSEKDILFLIELKRYYNPDNDKYQITNLHDEKVLSEKLKDLLQKSVGTLLLVNERFETINKFAKNISKTTKIKIIHALKVKDEHKVDLMAMNEKIKINFEKYEKIFKIESIDIIDFDILDKILELQTIKQ